tara:strand:- start:439 stop:891 length:453 start_codon:yes stop_codon:yes gene_type:complete
MNNIQTNIGDLKNQLKQLQEVNLAQIDRIQNLLEKISNPSFEKLSYREQYDLKKSLSDTGRFIKDYIDTSNSKLDYTAKQIFLYCLFTSSKESELYKKVQIESVKHLSAKEIPFNIFKSIMEDKDISQLEKNYLIQERGDKRYKVKEVSK